MWFLALQSPMIGNWSDKYGRKPFMVMGFATASLPLLVILLNLQFGVSMLFYFPAQVRKHCTLTTNNDELWWFMLHYPTCYTCSVSHGSERMS